MTVTFQRFYRYHEHLYQKSIQENQKSVIYVISYWNVFKKCFPQLLNIFLVFAVTLSVFPAVLSGNNYEGCAKKNNPSVSFRLELRKRQPCKIERIFSFFFFLNSISEEQWLAAVGAYAWRLVFLWTPFKWDASYSGENCRQKNAAHIFMLAKLSLSVQIEIRFYFRYRQSL